METVAASSVPTVNTKTFHASVIGIFASASAYGYAILTAPRALWSAVTIAFLAVLLVIFVSNLLEILRSPDEAPAFGIGTVLIYALALHLALILGFYLSGHMADALWVADSRAVHLPGAINVANYIHGKEAISSVGVPFGRVFLTQAFVGFFFSFLGVNPVASALALMLAKLLAVFVLFHLGKTMFNTKVGLVGALIYIFSPTIIYYTTVFYKEAVVQLIVAAILLSVLKIYLKPGNWKYWLLLVVSLAGVLNDRFYLFFFFALTFVPLALMGVKRHNSVYFPVIIALMVFILYAMSSKYIHWMFGSDVSFRNVLQRVLGIIRGARATYISYPDITAINLSLPYPLAVIKLLFSPFFTVNKFKLFSDYSYILIWASFLNQAVILLSIRGMYRAVRNSWQTNWFLIFPFFLFLCVFGYVAPYIGRLRDSFFPIISIYSAYAVCEIYITALRVKPWKLGMHGADSSVQG